MSSLNPNLNTQSGFIKLILLVIIALLVLGYFNIDIKSEVEKPTTQSNLSYASSLVSKVWGEYLSKPILYFWNNIFLGILWAAFINNFELIKKGMSPTNFETKGPESLPPYNPQ